MKDLTKLSLRELHDKRKLADQLVKLSPEYKEFSLLDKEWNERIGPHKTRAKTIFDKRGRDSGKFRIDNQTVTWSVNEIKPHLRATIKLS